ncbi:hypothetical protein NWF34_11640 [Gordonia sp. GONU]|jgi:hypothetical protein|uniref:hypothetical protein n=1 Tax=Gordonia TaxID=2053 RepID=UPI0009E4B038|nr:MULTISPECIES: hypothetical protein [Gordonia]MCR8897599.1 hypothetical protein [Gordonia sp. GONU]
MNGKKPYAVPVAGIEHNEFVGSLGPYGNGNPVNTELHVRYGVRGGRYYDWTIELIAREGDVDSFRATGEHPVRYVMDSFSVEPGAVVHRVRTGPGPDDFETTVVRRLYAGDGAVVDSGYDFFLKQLADQWDARHETRAPRAVATFGFAQHNRDAEFRDVKYPWVRNTVVCIDDDPADDVVGERVKHYFPDGGTVAVHCRSDSRMKFLKIDAGATPDGSSNSTDGDLGPMTATGYTSMGMMVDAIYRGGEWIDDELLS